MGKPSRLSARKLISGRPSFQRRRLRQNRSVILSFRQAAWPPTCGVMMTWGRSQSLLEIGSGSCSRHVHHGPGQMPAFQCRHQIALDHQRSAGDIHQHGPRLHFPHRRGIDHAARRRVQRHAEDKEIDQRQQLVEPLEPAKAIRPQSGLSTGNMSTARIRVSKGLEQPRQPPADAAQADDADRAAGQIARRPADEFLLLLARKNVGRLRVQAVIRAIVCSATWSAKAPEALVTRISESITDGNQAVIHAGG